MAPKQSYDKQVQFQQEHSKSIPVSLQQSQLQRSLVGRSNSAITQKKNGTSKLRRHAKSEPISSPKDTLCSTQASAFTLSDIHRKSETPKRPTYLPIHVQTPSPNRIPSGTDPRDLPGERIKSANGIGNENRLLRIRVQKLEEKQAKLDVLQASLDRLQHDYLKLNELCLRKSQIDEKRLGALEFALKQVTLDNEKLRNERKTEKDRENDEKRESSPALDREKTNSWKSSSSSSSRQNVSVNQPTQGEFRAAFNSFNFLLNAIRERDSELNVLKMHLFKVEQAQKQAQKSVYSPSPVFHYPPEYGNLDYSGPPLYHQTPNHVPTGVLTPPSDFAPQSLGTAASLEDCQVGSDGYQSQTSPETPQQHK